MSAPTVAGRDPRRDPALLLTVLAAVLALAAAGCLVVAVVEVLAAPGSALLLAGVIALAGWLVKTATTALAVAGLPALGCLAALAVVAPWLPVLAVLAVFTLRGGGVPWPAGR